MPLQKLICLSSNLFLTPLLVQYHSLAIIHSGYHRPTYAVVIRIETILNGGLWRYQTIQLLILGEFQPPSGYEEYSLLPDVKGVVAYLLQILHYRIPVQKESDVLGVFFHLLPKLGKLLLVNGIQLWLTQAGPLSKLEVFLQVSIQRFLYGRQGNGFHLS